MDENEEMLEESGDVIVIELGKVLTESQYREVGRYVHRSLLFLTGVGRSSRRVNFRTDI